MNPPMSNDLCFQLCNHPATAQALPAGWRFIPTDEEIVAAYLKPKVEHRPLPPNLICEIDIRQWDPKTLSESYEAQGGKWYFFTPRYKKDPNGSRPNRSVRNGFWKATGKDTKVRNKDGQDIGKKTTLVFYEGPSNKESRKTNWIMYEYALTSYTKPTGMEDTMRDPKLLDEWVLCEIHTHGASNRKPSGFETLHTLVEEEDDNTNKVTDNSNSIVAMGEMNTRQVEHGMPIFSQTLPSHGTTSFDHQMDDLLPMTAFQGDNNNVVSSCNISSLNQNADELQTMVPLTSSSSNSSEPSYTGYHGTDAAKDRDVVTFAPSDFNNKMWWEYDDEIDQLISEFQQQTEIVQPSKRKKIV